MTRTLERRRNEDPFTLARSLFGFDPFAGLTPRRGSGGFAPRFEVKEAENEFVIRADLPGVAEADVELSLHDGVLTVSGKREAESRQESDTYYLYERRYGSFSRSFSLPDSADGDAADAKLADGVLTVTLPKKAASKPKKITLG